MTLAIRRLLEPGRTPRAEAIDAFLAGAPRPDGRGDDGDLRLPRRGRRGPPAALGLRPALGAALHAPSSGTDLWYLIQELPTGSRVEYKLEVQRRRQLAPDRAIRSTRTSRTTRSAPTRSATAPATRRPEWSQPDPEARPGTLETLAVAARGARRDAGGPGLPAGALPRLRGATRCWSSTTASDYLRFTRAADGARQPDPPPRDRADGGRADPVARSPARVRRRPGATPGFLAEELLPALEARYPLRQRAGGARPDGRELRRGRLASPPPGATRACSAGCCCSRARSPSPTSARAPRTRSSTPVVEFVNAFRDQPRARGRAGLRHLRHLRVADLREPLAGAAAAARPAWRCATSRRATATTGRTGATACARGSPGSSPGRSGWCTSSRPAPASGRRLDSPRIEASDHGGRDAADRTLARRRPLLAVCFEEIVKRLDLALPVGGDTVRFEVERVTIEPFDLRQPVPLRRGPRPAHALVPHRRASGSRRRSSMTTLRAQQPVVDPDHGEAHDLRGDDAARASRCPRPGCCRRRRTSRRPT